MDAPLRWERLYLANLARPPSAWAARQRFVSAIGIALGVCWALLVALLAVSGRLLDLALLAPVVAVGAALALLRHLYLYMGIVRGAQERERRRGS